MSEFSSPDIVEMMLAEWVFDQYFNMTKCYYLHTVSDGYIYTHNQYQCVKTNLLRPGPQVLRTVSPAG